MGDIQPRPHPWCFSENFTGAMPFSQPDSLKYCQYNPPGIRRTYSPAPHTIFHRIRVEGTLGGYKASPLQWVPLLQRPLIWWKRAFFPFCHPMTERGPHLGKGPPLMEGEAAAALAHQRTVNYKADPPKTSHVTGCLSINQLQRPPRLDRLFINQSNLTGCLTINQLQRPPRLDRLFINQSTSKDHMPRGGGAINQTWQVFINQSKLQRGVHNNNKLHQNQCYVIY